MKNNFRSALTCIALLIASFTFSQISGKYYGEKDDFKAMAKRTMIVELLEEDAEVIKRLSKKESRAAQLADYKAFIADYNTMIKTTVPKYWTYNVKIEYKNASEVAEIKKGKSEKYVILSYFELSDTDLDFFDRSELVVPALRYSRSEQKDRMPDYKIYLPSSFIRDGKKYLEADFKMALLGMQANIKWVIKNDKKMQYQDFTEEESKVNCSKLKSKTVLIEKKYLYEKTTEAEAKAAYGGNMEWATADQINKAFLDKTPGKAIMFAIPYALAKGSIGPISQSSLGFFKIIVDCETGDVLWSNNPGNMPIGKNISYFIIEKEFKYMAACKN